jgi:uncharacterized protein involved in exopolysaccharide biosynthesis
VLLAVGLSRVDSASKTRIIDRLLGETPATLPQSQIPKAMLNSLAFSLDRKTGLLDVSARHSDSALARLLATRIVDVGAETYSAVMRSQASAQRAGQERRVALTEQQLRQTEARQLEFLRSNRSLSSYSATSLQNQALQRDVQIAQQAYTEAVGAREAAYARELEQTPAVVMVDPVPSELSPVPKYHLFYSLAVAVVVAFAYMTLLLAREGLLALQADGSASALRLLAAIRRIPLVGRLAPRKGE